MFIRRRKHSVPELNTTSTADISFMLLILFLVASSLGMDKALHRKLPPADDTQKEKTEQLVDRSKMMELQLVGGGGLLCDGDTLPVGLLRERVRDFVLRVGDAHVISLTADRDARYEAYFEVQNEIMAAYRTARNQLARGRFGFDFALCSADQQQVIRRLCPLHIAETYMEDSPQ